MAATQAWKKRIDAYLTCINVIKQNGYALQFVEEQTPEICLAAVQQNGFALQFVEEQTSEICLTAVRQNITALLFVEDSELSAKLKKDLQSKETSHEETEEERIKCFGEEALDL